MVKTEEVSIEYEGQQGIVVLKEMTWGESNDCLRKTNERKDDNFDLVALHEQRLLASITTAPFPVTIESLRALPRSDGDKLFDVMQTLNSLSVEEVKNSEAPQTPEKKSGEQPKQTS